MKILLITFCRYCPCIRRTPSALQMARQPIISLKARSAQYPYRSGQRLSQLTSTSLRTCSPCLYKWKGRRYRIISHYASLRAKVAITPWIYGVIATLTCEDAQYRSDVTILESSIFKTFLGHTSKNQSYLYFRPISTFRRNAIK